MCIFSQKRCLNLQEISNDFTVNSTCLAEMLEQELRVIWGIKMFKSGPIGRQQPFMVTCILLDWSTGLTPPSCEPFSHSGHIKVCLTLGGKNMYRPPMTCTKMHNVRVSKNIKNMYYITDLSFNTSDMNNSGFGLRPVVDFISKKRL